jgi:fibronectin type 3 domain-containing protein
MASGLRENPQKEIDQMSENSNTENAEGLNEEKRTVVFHVHEEQAAEILETFDVPMPMVSDLDEIRIVIRH